MTVDEPVLCEVDARGIATVTLNRPRVGNAYNDALIDGLIDTFARLDRDAGLRCVVMKGAGKHFQLGADLAFLDRLRTVSPEENHEFSRRTVAAIRGLQSFSRPTISLVHGGCFGGGVRYRFGGSAGKYCRRYRRYETGHRDGFGERVAGRNRHLAFST